MKYFRVVRFSGRNQTSDKLPSMKDPKTGKLMLFTSYFSANAWINENGYKDSLYRTFPDEFEKTVTGRYIFMDDPVASQRL